MLSLEHDDGGRFVSLGSQWIIIRFAVCVAIWSFGYGNSAVAACRGSGAAVEDALDEGGLCDPSRS